MRILLLPLIGFALLLIETGCGQAAQPVPPTPAAAVPATKPAPDPSLWAGKTVDAAVMDYLSCASKFTSALKGVENASGVQPNKAAVVMTAEQLRIARFALADLSKPKSLSTDTLKKLQDASAAVSEQVARLLAIPEARQSYQEAFLMIRTAPAVPTE